MCHREILLEDSRRSEALSLVQVGSWLSIEELETRRCEEGLLEPQPWLREIEDGELKQQLQDLDDVMGGESGGPAGNGDRFSTETNNEDNPLIGFPTDREGAGAAHSLLTTESLCGTTTSCLDGRDEVVVNGHEGIHGHEIDQEIGRGD